MKYCDRCAAFGLYISPRGYVELCPKIQLGNEHPVPNPAAMVVKRLLYKTGQRPNQHLFAIAREIALLGTAENPVCRDRLITNHFDFAQNDKLRLFHRSIELLRANWLLPVASRKMAPAGYWISVDCEDFSEWVGRAKSAPFTQLSTIYRLAKANFPIFAQQLELEFISDLKTDPFDQTPDVTPADCDVGLALS